MKKIEGWNEIERLTAPSGDARVMYEIMGYRVVVSDADYMPGGYNISACPVDMDSYFPSIYIGSHYGLETQEIEIQTTSYGSLAISEIDKLMSCMRAAQAVAQEIKKAFPECFSEL